MSYPANESVSGTQLRTFIERLDEEVKSVNDMKRDVFKEAKGTGFDVKAMKIILSRRRQDQGERMELEALVELYEAALGSHVHVREAAE